MYLNRRTVGQDGELCVQVSFLIYSQAGAICEKETKPNVITFVLVVSSPSFLSWTVSYLVFYGRRIHIM